jgi:hypothetical protein
MLMPSDKKWLKKPPIIVRSRDIVMTSANTTRNCMKARMDAGMALE